jgi:TonB family protein
VEKIAISRADPEGMNRELKRSGIISIAIHVIIITFLIVRSFVSCYRINARNISPFIDLQVGSLGAQPKGGAGAESAISQDDAFPVPAKKSSVEVSKKLVKRPAKISPKKLSEKEIKHMLGEGVADNVSTVPAVGTGTGGGKYHPYALYLSQIRAIMYEAWQQPSSLIGQKGLVTDVEIRIQRDGQITSKKISTSSGNSQMDDSVLRALEKVERVPELPAGFGGSYQDITIDFELTELAALQNE